MPSIDVTAFKKSAIGQGSHDACLAACVVSVLRYIDAAKWTSPTNIDEFIAYLVKKGAPPTIGSAGNDITKPMEYIDGYLVTRISHDPPDHSKSYFKTEVCNDLGGLWGNVDRALHANTPPLLGMVPHSFRGEQRPSTHIVVVLGLNGDQVTYFDPDGEKVPNECMSDLMPPKWASYTGFVHMIVAKK